MHAEQIISTHPQVQGNVNHALAQCIEECFDCAQSCASCADACLGEQMVRNLTQCIRLNLDCADICVAAGFIATRRTGSNEALIRTALEGCAMACKICGDECDRHAQHHEHCRICAESCRRCEEACRDALPTIGAKH
ncbi:MAG: four-helix bundle copper-binding protein [Methylocystis sp.]|nr:MAG: four-helix bundle copper-binding protein [Methylocystis sp.]